jgi:hypothetical protein
MDKNTSFQQPPNLFVDTILMGQHSPVATDLQVQNIEQNLIVYWSFHPIFFCPCALSDYYIGHISHGNEIVTVQQYVVLVSDTVAPSY